jgi:hypothetical protein
MVFAEFTGCCLVGFGAYAIARPMSVRTVPSGEMWKKNPERAEQEQRAYGTMVGALLLLSGLVLIGVGILDPAL